MPELLPLPSAYFAERGRVGEGADLRHYFLKLHQPVFMLVAGEFDSPAFTGLTLIHLGAFMRDQLRSTLRDLTKLHAPPGFEQPVVRYLRDAFAPLSDSVEVDTFGNLYAIKR